MLSTEVLVCSSHTSGQTTNTTFCSLSILDKQETRKKTWTTTTKKDNKVASILLTTILQITVCSIYSTILRFVKTNNNKLKKNNHAWAPTPSVDSKKKKYFEVMVFWCFLHVYTRRAIYMHYNVYIAFDFVYSCVVFFCFFVMPKVLIFFLNAANCRLPCSKQ